METTSPRAECGQAALVTLICVLGLLVLGIGLISIGDAYVQKSTTTTGSDAAAFAVAHEATRQLQREGTLQRPLLIAVAVELAAANKTELSDLEIFDDEHGSVRTITIRATVRSTATAPSFGQGDSVESPVLHTSTVRFGQTTSAAEKPSCCEPLEVLATPLGIDIDTFLAPFFRSSLVSHSGRSCSSGVNVDILADETVRSVLMAEQEMSQPLPITVGAIDNESCRDAQEAYPHTAAARGEQISIKQTEQAHWAPVLIANGFCELGDATFAIESSPTCQGTPIVTTSHSEPKLVSNE